MKNYLLALLIFIGHLSPIQSAFASEDEHEGEEGISKINNNMAKRLGVETAYLASKTLNQTIPVYGSTTIGAEQLFQVGARYNGVIKAIKPTVGDKVKKGELLAVIESNESLNTYKITSPVSGVVLQRNGNIGGITQNTSLFEIVNFDTLWAEFKVFTSQYNQIKVGQHVDIEQGEHAFSSVITNIIPAKDQPYVLARVRLNNTELKLTSGQLLKGNVKINQFEVDLAVEKVAIQELGGQLGVFVKEDEEYEFAPLVLGRSDKNYIEVIDGLSKDAEYVNKNSYLIKADILKSEVEDDD
ncbi:acetyl-CoA carboxylase biotin carboxyl carrier protein subunit [Pseudoalteromonas sp. S327]|uniref:efflux RND transporter periplasmic adaptor subunit n=1 Tax=unclassified Pseudoalteromonas TaxID=194690 RepID=UPI00110A6F2B|nr:MULTISPECIES: HlyD family efflux transporter periplasmic adaptor subunit [unclassified Pseudoalteromonas]TMO03356.1 acetyl-CoA carboxylase biotin carboxyl carrier protein subunit [Pseudoalteromonas sp. S327]TMO16371.1 acetyl-CoA carboxylase biotin carboxyl carrier protein subunit [Pseudoalteromonas sp. S326]